MKGFTKEDLLAEQKKLSQFTLGEIHTLYAKAVFNVEKINYLKFEDQANVNILSLVTSELMYRILDVQSSIDPQHSSGREMLKDIEKIMRSRNV